VSHVQAVLFDLDGTLLDRDAALRAFVRSQHARMSAALGHIAREKYEARFIDLDDRGHRWKDAVYQSLVQEFAITKATWPTLLSDYEARFCEHCVAFDGAHEVLQVLEARYKMALVTNGRSEFQSRSIQVLGIAKYFGAILISEAEGTSKPGAEIFRRALQRLQVGAHAAVFVGDHPNADIGGAQGVGMRAIWKSNPFWDAPRQANAVIHHLNELPGVLERLGATPHT
jgi:putative hydrolase of the HAD superfamily